QRDSSVVKVTVGPGGINREKSQGVKGLSHPNRRLRTPREVWNSEQRNKKEADKRLRLPRFGRKALFGTFPGFFQNPLKDLVRHSDLLLPFHSIKERFALFEASTLTSPSSMRSIKALTLPALLLHQYICSLCKKEGKKSPKDQAPA